MQRREDLDARPRARHEHVETAPAVGLVERPEVHREPARRVGAVAHGDEHDVAFVALDRLEVLHEERLVAVRREERLRGLRRVVAPQPLDLVLDGALLRDAHGADAEARARPARPARRSDRARVRHHGLRDCAGLRRVVLARAAAVPAGRDGSQVDARLVPARVRRRERDEAALVELAVAERDEARVAAAVVPPQRRAVAVGQPREREREHALDPPRGRGVVLLGEVLVAALEAREEALVGAAGARRRTGRPAARARPRRARRRAPPGSPRRTPPRRRRPRRARGGARRTAGSSGNTA